MIKTIFYIINGLTDKQADVVISAMGLISAAVVAGVGLFGSVLTFVLSKRSERKMELRKIKETQYIDFLGSLAEAKVANHDEKHEIDVRLSSKLQTIYLVGSNDVQRALKNFTNYFTEKKESTDEQDKLYAELIMAMKKDLYGKTEASLEAIQFTVFN